MTASAARNEVNKQMAAADDDVHVYEFPLSRFPSYGRMDRWMGKNHPPRGKSDASDKFRLFSTFFPIPE